MFSKLPFGKKRATTPAPSFAATVKPLGLKTLTDASLGSPRRPNCVKRKFVACPPASLPPASAAADEGKDDTDADDGEGDDGDEEADGRDNACWASYGRRSHCRRFPPPIPLLARTANLPGHMPWVLRRTYTDDGSLVIREVRVRHHEYFRARREHGRLTLQLVELDGDSPLFDPEEGPPPSPSSSRLQDHDEGKSTSTRETRMVQPRHTATAAKEMDVPRIQPRFAMWALVNLSSSMPEPAAFAGMRRRRRGDRPPCSTAS